MVKETLKDQANKLYKKQQYSIAAGLYKKYASEPHDDNKNAHYNMGLCYFKLNRFQQCIQACNIALSLDSTYAKCYYRKTLAYQQLDNLFGTYTTAREYCNLLKDKRDEEWQKMRKIADNAYEKLSLPQPDEIKQKDYFLTPRKKEQKQNGDEFKWSQKNIVELVRSKKKRQAMNALYFLINRTKGDKKKKYQERLKQVKILSEQEMENFEFKEEKLKEQKRIKQEQQVKKMTDPELRYFECFEEPLRKKRDLFEGFPKVIESILTKKQLSHKQMQDLLIDISQKYAMFDTLQISQSGNQKKVISELMKTANIKQAVINKYCQ